MYQNQFVYPLQHPIPSFPTAPPGPQPVYYYLQPVHQGVSANVVNFNTEWGQEQEQSFLHNANQMTGGAPSIPEVTATTGEDRRCRWFTAGALCGREFPSFNDLMVHMGHEHDVKGSADRKLVCQWLTRSGHKCDKTCRRDGIRRHIETHVGGSVPCDEPECDKTFSRKDSMRAHAKKQHRKKGP